IPVGNILPVAPLNDARRLELRQRLGIEPSSLIVSTFGSDLPSTDLRVMEVLSEIARQEPSVRVLTLGRRSNGLAKRLADEPALRGRIASAGALDDVELSEHLGLSNIYLALFPDGASTRRSSLITALAHGVPVVSNDGRLTDNELRQSGAVVLLADE